MNVFRQDEKLQHVELAAAGEEANEAYAGDELELQHQYGDRDGYVSHHSNTVQQGDVLDREQKQSASNYRTRWVAWSVIAVGWACSLAAILLRGGSVEWFLAAVLSAIVVVSGIAPVLAAKGLSAVRVLSRQETREGGQLQVQLTLKRSYFVPLVWLAVRDEATNESSLSGIGIRFCEVLVPSLRKEASIRYTMHKLRRGRHPFGPVSVTVGDWLGLTAIRKQLECKSEFVVLPGLPAIDLLEPPGERRSGASVSIQGMPLAGAALDYRGEAGREEITAAVRAAGLGPDSRPYREGDSLRHLDWRSAAKGRGLQTKVYALEQPAQTVIAVDTAASAYGWDDRLFDACVGWASLAVQQAAALGSMVKLLTGQRQEVELQEDNSSEPVRQESEQKIGIARLLRSMALLRADGKGSLAGSLIKGNCSLTRGGTILVFTADWRGGRSWGELAGFAGEQGCRMELFIVTRSSVPSFAMREQQKWLERGDVKVTWLHVPASMSALPYAEEGGGADELEQR